MAGKGRRRGEMQKTYIVDVKGPHDTTTVDQFVRQKEAELPGWRLAYTEPILETFTNFRDSDGGIIGYHKQYRVLFLKQ